MEIPAPGRWVHVTTCERSALEMLRQALQEREEQGGRLAVQGQGLFSLRRAGAVEAYLSPRAAASLRHTLQGLEAEPCDAPPDHPTLKLEVGDSELWKAVVRQPDSMYVVA